MTSTTALTSTVVRIPASRLRRRKSRPAVAQPKKSSVHRAKVDRQLYAAIGVAAVSVALTALSLSHLAHGFSVVTNSVPWQAWVMAVVIDCGFIACEVAQITAYTPKAREVATKYGRKIVIGTLAISAAMNAYGFAETKSGLALVAPIVIGAGIPLAIWGLNQLAATFYIGAVEGETTEA